MYVDKRLAGIQAVQTLSRLNRTHPLKDDTFVLDFVNDPDEIQEAFRQYYDGSVMGEEVDPDRLYEVKAELDGSGIYLQDEVDGFSRIFFAPKRRQSPADHKNMNALLDQAVARFAQLQNDEEDEAELWRGKTQAFRNLYSFLSQVIPYQDSDLEKLFTYLRHLALKLPKRKTGPGTSSMKRWSLTTTGCRRSAKARSIWPRAMPSRSTGRVRSALAWSAKNRLPYRA